MATGCGTAADAPERAPVEGDIGAEESSPVVTRPPTASSEEVNSLVASNTAFALDLYKEVRRETKDTENIFYSPFSISSALAMTYAGARGDTSSAMAKTLHFALPEARLHAAFGALNALIIPPATEKSITVRTANTLFGDHTLRAEPAFTSLVSRNYGAGVQPLDFARSPDPSRLTINKWVSTQTNNRINDLLAPGTINSSTRLVLVNAIYFLGNWVSQFDAKHTIPAPFTLADGKVVEAPLMQKRLKTNDYVESDLYQALRLPYKSSESGKAGYELVVALPREGKLAQFESKLSLGLLEQISRSTDETTLVDLQLPKFQLDGISLSLKPALLNLGMGAAFSGADFSGISTTDNFNVSDVIHKAMVKVDEKGTEAAAATAVIVERTSVSRPSDPVPMIVNRPFFVFLREANTGSVLFMGRVSNLKK